MESLTLVVMISAVYLLFLALWDIKTYNKTGIPSIYSNIFLFLVPWLAFLFNTATQTQILFNMLLAFLLALVLLDFNLFSGESDLKIFVALGVLLPNILSLLVFALLLAVFKVTAGTLIKKTLRVPLEEIPFIPFILIAFLVNYGIWV